MAAEADLCVRNLECAISTRGTRRPDPREPFFFRAPPEAVRALRHLGVDCVTLANNHALDYGVEALTDPLRHLADAGIAQVGAGPDEASARRPAVLETGCGWAWWAWRTAPGASPPPSTAPASPTPTSPPASPAGSPPSSAPWTPTSRR